MVETSITTALLMVILLAVLSQLDSISGAQAYQSDRTNNLDDMRTVLNKMTKELRQASTVSESISTATTITFSTAVNGTSTQITYTATGSTLTKRVGTGTAFTVLKNLTPTNTTLFTYTSANSGVQWVEINLQVTPTRRPTTTLVLDSEINLRNRTSTLTGA